MVSFARNEIISSTQLVRQFSSLMNQLKEKSVSKVGIVRNNEMEAVIIPIEEYEQLKFMAENQEKRAVKEYFGIMDEDTFSVMEEALKDCRKVDANEW